MAGRARAALAAKNNPQLEDHSWKRYAQCGYCDRQIMVNNYPDHRSRTPKFLGLVICPWCDPRFMDDRWLWKDGPKGEKPRIRNQVLYRTLMGRWLATKVAELDGYNDYDSGTARLVAIAVKLFS